MNYSKLEIEYLDIVSQENKEEKKSKISNNKVSSSSLSNYFRTKSASYRSV